MITNIKVNSMRKTEMIIEALKKSGRIGYLDKFYGYNGERTYVIWYKTV